MPLVAHNNLPCFERLRREGQNILPEGRALSQDIREIHIGLLNMMQDSALRATERQFFRLIGESNQITQIYVHPFTLPEIPRGNEAQAHIDQYYERFEDIQKDGLDGLIVTGTNLSAPDLSTADFWSPLQKILEWSWDNVPSTIFACLATHAVMQMEYEQTRTALPAKLWGVYRHRVCARTHPLVQGMNTVFDVPHSRFNAIAPAQFEQAGMRTLVHSDVAGVHLATSADGFRRVCFQGHQEYDTISLLKEYKREVELHLSGGREDYPSVPANYFGAEALEILKKYKAAPDGDFPEEQIEPLIENTWRDSARAIIGNWIGQVYQTTNVDRRKLFMNEIDPHNPLGLS